MQRRAGKLVLDMAVLEGCLSLPEGHHVRGVRMHPDRWNTIELMIEGPSMPVAVDGMELVQVWATQTATYDETQPRRVITTTFGAR